MRWKWAALAAGALLAIQTPAWPAATSESVDLTYPEGEAPDEGSGPPVISGDGRWVAFVSASELMSEDDSESVDLYVRDLVEDRTILVTGAADEAYRVHYDPSISDDGRFVAFISQGDGLVPEDENGSEDVYVKDLRTGELFVASARPRGAVGGGLPAVSGDGKWVAFASNGLTRDDRNDSSDVYVRNLFTGKTFLVSRTTGGRQVDGAFDDIAISDDGSRVAYSMYGGLFVYDRTTERRVRADVNNRGEAAHHASPWLNISLSGNGRMVAFSSNALNMSPRADSGGYDVYVRDLRRKRTLTVSVYSNGRHTRTKDSWSVALSRSGRFIAFGSAARFAGRPDGGRWDTFVRDLEERRTRLVTPDCDGAGYPSLSNDARWIAFVAGGCSSAGPEGTAYARGPLARP